MEELVRRGWTRCIGLCNASTSEVEAVTKTSTIKPAVIQVNIPITSSSKPAVIQVNIPITSTIKPAVIQVNIPTTQQVPSNLPSFR